MKKCPLLAKKCIEHQCQFYINLIGSNPQTGQPVDRWDCAVSWLPLLLVENANQTRQAAASTDKVANEVRKHHESFVVVATNKVNQRLLDAEQKTNLIEKGA